MKPSAILREAARRIEARHYGFGCVVMAEIIRDSYKPSEVIWDEADAQAAEIADRWLRPLAAPRISEPKQRKTGWFDLDCDLRVTALCLAAAIAKAEGK
jgi:hypothetical protein